MGEDLDCVLRIPPKSPSRRDYGIRSPARSSSPVSFDIRSPWLPRDQVAPGTSREVEAFRKYESNPPPLVLERSACYSGPLPVVVPPGLPDRSLPSYSGPLPGFSTAAIESFEFATWARIYHRQHAHDSNSLPGSPEVGSSRGSSEGANDESTKQGMQGLAFPAAQFSARAGMHGRVGSVSGELGRSDEVAKPVRGYKSGELLVLEGAVNDGVGDPVQERRGSGSKDANWDEPMVTIPFKWEEKGSRSRASSNSTSTATPKSNGAEICAGVGDFSFGSSHTKTSVESGSEASVSDARVSNPVKAALVAAPKSALKQAGVRSAVPFKWEDAPGKPKLEEKKKNNNNNNNKKTMSSESTPALQLPPRLASASVKRSSWTTSTPSTRTHSNSSRARTQPHISPESTSSKHSRQSQQLPKSKSSPQQHSPGILSPQPSAQPSPQRSLQPSAQPDGAQARHTLHPNFLSGPLDSAAKPKGVSAASRSGPISQFGLPQYQSADFFSSRSSPTSTLHGPGGSSSDGGHSHGPSSSCSDNCSRKSASVTYSHSQSAGTSVESLEQWSDQGHESFEPETAGTTITTPHRRLPTSKPPPSPSSPSKPKPPMNPSSHLHPEDLHPEDLHPLPATRLPYKMPETPTQEIVVVRRAASPSRALRQSSKCFELPRFLSKGSSSVMEENASRDAPSSCVEDGYRSPAYKATLELLSPSPSTTSRARSTKLGSASPRHFAEGLCNSLKHSLPIFSKRNGGKKKTAIVNDNPFTKRHPSLML